MTNIPHAAASRSLRALPIALLALLVDMSLTIGGVRPEEELVEELLQRAVGNLDAGSGFVATHFTPGAMRRW